MSDFPFVVGRVNAQESTLLVQSQLDRMIGARTAEEAFKILLELQYAEFIDEEVGVEDFYNLIRQGLFETKTMILDGTSQAEVFNFYWAQFDVNNLKKALKLKLIEGKTEIENFSEEVGFSSLGSLNQNNLETLVFKGMSLEDFDENIQDVVKSAKSIYESQDFLAVEQALDDALVRYILKLKSKIYDSFFHTLIDLWVKQTNIRNLSRSVLIRKTKMKPQEWIETDELAYFEIKNIETFEDLSTYLGGKGFSNILSQLDPKDSEKSMYAIEKAISAEYDNFIKWETTGGNSDIAILMGYFEKRMRNAQKLKLVMYAKFNDFEADKIYELLEQL